MLVSIAVVPPVLVSSPVLLVPLTIAVVSVASVVDDVGAVVDVPVIDSLTPPLDALSSAPPVVGGPSLVELEVTGGPPLPLDDALALALVPPSSPQPAAIASPHIHAVTHPDPRELV